MRQRLAVVQTRPVTIERRSRRFSAAQLERLARRLMNAAPLCALATASPGGRPHINHMYFAWSGPFEVFWISDPDSRHSRNLVDTPSAAIKKEDEHETEDRPDQEKQVGGRA